MNVNSVKHLSHITLCLLFSSFFLFSSIILNWTPATDDVTPQGLLQYEVSISSRDNIRTLADVEKNGIVMIPYTAGIRSAQIDNLKRNRKYYFNIIVKDEAGNKAVYNDKGVTIQR